MRIIAFLVGLFGWLFGLTPYEIYCYNFGDCVESCMSRGLDEKTCNSRCWETWKFYLSGKYTIKDGEVVEIDGDDGDSDDSSTSSNRVAENNTDPAPNSSEPVAVAIVVDKNGAEEHSIASSATNSPRLSQTHIVHGSNLYSYDLVY